MRARLEQPHGRRHKAPPQPFALTTTSEPARENRTAQVLSMSLIDGGEAVVNHEPNRRTEGSSPNVGESRAEELKHFRGLQFRSGGTSSRTPCGS